MLLTIVFAGLFVAVGVAVVIDAVRSRRRHVFVTTAALSPPEKVIEWAQASFAQALRRYGYRLVFIDDAQLTFERSWRPISVWLVTVVLFPIGLIAFVLGRRTSVLIVVIAGDDRGGTELRMSGEAPASMAAKLAEIADPPHVIKSSSV